MNALSKHIDHSPTDCETILIRLLQFGAPRVSYTNGGWHAAIDMHTANPGADYKVRSDFNHTSPSAALHLLVERVNQSLKAALGQAAP